MTIARMYAEALSQAQASKKTPKQLIDGLKEVLSRRGHSKLMPQIFSEYQKIEAAKSRTGTKVTVAHEKDRAEALKKLFEIDEEKEAVVCTDEDLISGFVVSGRDFRHDASGRRALLNLYNHLIHSN